MPRAKQRTPELKEHVLATAIELLDEAGVAGFTTRRLAERAGTSAPSLYELFGDKAGVLREVYFESFRLLDALYENTTTSGDPRTDLVALMSAYRDFNRQHPILVELMTSRPFRDFSPAAEDVAAATRVQKRIVRLVKQAADSGQLRGDPIDLANAVVCMAQGLAAAERGDRLGRKRRDVDRRWETAFNAILYGSAADAR